MPDDLIFGRSDNGAVSIFSCSQANRDPYHHRYQCEPVHATQHYGFSYQWPETESGKVKKEELETYRKSEKGMKVRDDGGRQSKENRLRQTRAHALGSYLKNKSRALATGAR